MKKQIKYQNTDEIKSKLESLELSCPECPSSPNCNCPDCHTYIQHTYIT